jgi:DNA-binding SARP family transcriptional activator/DNA-binding XRE family transcriptional regulator
MMADDAPDGVGELVRERRVSAGLTQRELAAAAGWSIGALRDLEQGRTRCPRWGSVVAIAAALSMDHRERTELAEAWSGGQPDAGAGYGPAGTVGARALAGLRIGALGPLMARRGEGALDLGSPRQRTVLGLLALHWPAAVPRDLIIDVLWGDRPPDSAVTRVQAYASRLRRLLGPSGAPRRNGGPVPLACDGYRLGEGMGLDIAEFRELSRRADGAAARGECRLACALYERSLGLWRGEVLADLELLNGYPAVAEVTRCREDVVLRFAGAAAAARRAGRALPPLRALCAREPFNEQAHAILMTALAATGQQAAAIGVFSELRRRLDRELGIRPGPQVAAAHLRILRQQAD